MGPFWALSCVTRRERWCNKSENVPLNLFIASILRLFLPQWCARTSPLDSQTPSKKFSSMGECQNCFFSGGVTAENSYSAILQMSLLSILALEPMFLMTTLGYISWMNVRVAPCKKQNKLKTTKMTSRKYKLVSRFWPLHNFQKYKCQVWVVTNAPYN